MLGRRKIINANIFEITYDDPAIQGSRWCAYANFHLIGVGENKVHNDKVYTMVCSPDYVEQPLEEAADKKTIVMPDLTKDHISKILHDRIEEINAMQLSSWEEYYIEIKKSFYVD